MIFVAIIVDPFFVQPRSFAITKLLLLCFENDKLSKQLVEITLFVISSIKF